VGGTWHGVRSFTAREAIELPAFLEGALSSGLCDRRCSLTADAVKSRSKCLMPFIYSSFAGGYRVVTTASAGLHLIERSFAGRTDISNKEKLASAAEARAAAEPVCAGRQKPWFFLRVSLVGLAAIRANPGEVTT
jgi:hypothetical protein